MYSSPNVIKVINLRRMRLAGHVTHTGGRRFAHKVWVGKLRDRDYFKLKLIFKKWHRG